MNPLSESFLIFQAFAGYTPKLSNGSNLKPEIKDIAI